MKTLPLSLTLLAAVVSSLTACQKAEGPVATATAPKGAEATAATVAKAAHIDGKWFAYPGQVDPLERTIEPPKPIGEPPLKPEYLEPWKQLRAKLAEADKKGEPIASGYTHCLPDGMPAMMQGMFPMEVLESNGQVTIIQEAYQQIRRIYLNDKLPEWQDAEPRFWGHTAGHWEGDTLVMETVGIKENIKFRNVPHSPAMHISERLHLIDDNHMVDEVTVTDPDYLTAPWQWTWMYARKSGYKMYEYVCE
ncbi:MAG TPA: hypothetical protein VMH83_08820, partial [Candidatus Acidoferrum sp.]|nr:hypothetical protein [Candidatus Acidoferrum sp.]